MSQSDSFLGSFSVLCMYKGRTTPSQKFVICDLFFLLITYWTKVRQRNQAEPNRFLLASCQNCKIQKLLYVAAYNTCRSCKLGSSSLYTFGPMTRKRQTQNRLCTQNKKTEKEEFWWIFYLHCLIPLFERYQDPGIRPSNSNTWVISLKNGGRVLCLRLFR